MKQVTAEDARLRCEHRPRAGAPALLLLNPLGASLEVWDEQLPGLAERYELIRFDARGQGGSTSGSRRALTMQQLARDALAVLDACGIARAHLCGLSIGGMTAMQIAVSSPDRVMKLALCSTTTYMPPRQAWDERINTVLTQGMASLVDATLGRWLTAAFREAHPEAVEPIRAMLLRADPQGYAACAAAVRDADLREPIKNLTATTLVVGGVKDPSISPAQAALLASSIPDAKLAMLEGAHLVNVECAQQFTNLLLEFLGA